MLQFKKNESKDHYRKHKEEKKKRKFENLEQSQNDQKKSTEKLKKQKQETHELEEENLLKDEENLADQFTKEELAGFMFLGASAPEQSDIKFEQAEKPLARVAAFMKDK